jgi:hypothetical protein
MVAEKKNTISMTCTVCDVQCQRFLLIEGNSIRSTERITGADRNTVMKLLVMAGEKCEKLMGRVIVNSSGQGCGVR